ncbi:MAG: AbrB family transcriptional regulator [Candidatus Bathyarchaeia archaeon]
MSLDSTVGIAKIGTKSLRATVPEGIVAFLGIQAGDKLEWRMEMQNGERIVIVRKALVPEPTKSAKSKRK